MCYKMCYKTVCFTVQLCECVGEGGCLNTLQGKWHLPLPVFSAQHSSLWQPHLKNVHHTCTYSCTRIGYINRKKNRWLLLIPLWGNLQCFTNVHLYMMLSYTKNKRQTNSAAITVNAFLTVGLLMHWKCNAARAYSLWQQLLSHFPPAQPHESLTFANSQAQPTRPGPWRPASSLQYGNHILLWVTIFWCHCLTFWVKDVLSSE